MISFQAIKSKVSFGLIALAFAFGAQAAALPVLDGNLIRNLEGLTWVQYGDARSYSLAVSDFWYEHVTGEKSHYKVPISAANKGIFPIANEATRTAPGMENRYTTPSQSQGSTWFVTDPDTEAKKPVNGIVYDRVANAWDISLAALKTYLTVEVAPGDNVIYDPVLYFQNNQVDSSGSFYQSLATWARLWVTDDENKIIGDYQFANSHENTPGELLPGDGQHPYALVTEGGGGKFMGDVENWDSVGRTDPRLEIPADTTTDPDTPRLTDFVLSGGEICVAYGNYPGEGDGSFDPTNNKNALQPVPVSCDSSIDDLELALQLAGYNTISDPIVHNLGNDSFPYALVMPELNDLLATLYDDPLLEKHTLHLDIRLGCGNTPEYRGVSGDACLDVDDTNNVWGNSLTNGPESAVFGGTGTRQPPPVPEPGVMVLLGLGLAGLGFARRRKII